MQIKKEQLVLFAIISAIVGATILVIVNAAGPSTVSSSSATYTTSGNVVICDNDYLLFEAACPGDGNAGNLNTGLSALANNNTTFNAYSNQNSLQHNNLINTLTKSSSVPKVQSNGHGQFRTSCKYSHLLYDDPLVYPGQAGASHLHMFFGNTAVNANTTAETLANSGGGSCGGQSLNRTSYWIPALIDPSGNARIPEDVIIYYKATKPAEANRFPQGLGIISGAPKNTDPSYDPAALANWGCGTRDASTVTKRSRTVPNCNTGEYLLGFVKFGECWNGQLRSDDNVSHVVKSIGKNNDTQCPSSHPKIIPKITYNIVWPHNGNSASWRLSSDIDGAPNGTSLHGDWWGGWNDQVMDTWINSCVKAKKNCAPDVLGNGRSLLREAGSRFYDGPFSVKLP